MTELSPGVSMTPNDAPFPYGSAGVPMPGMQVRIVDVGTGRDCGVGEEGELWCRGDNVMKGYYKRPDVTRQCIDEQGWFHSGACSVVYMFITSISTNPYRYVCVSLVYCHNNSRLCIICTTFCV